MTEQTNENQESLTSVEDELNDLPAIDESAEEEFNNTDNEPEEESNDEPKEENQESDNDDSEEKNQEKPKKSNPFAKRLKKKNDRIAELEERLAQLEKPVTKEVKPDADPFKEPDPEDYENGATDPNYLKELAIIAGKKAFLEQKQAEEKKAETEKLVQTVEQAEENFNKKMSDAWEKHDDYQEVWENGKFQHKSDAVMHAIKSSENAGELTYQILKDKELCSKLEGMDPVSAIRTIGAMEAKLTPERPNKPKVSQFTKPFKAVSSGKPTSRLTMDDLSEKTSQSDFNESFPFEDLL